MLGRKRRVRKADKIAKRAAASVERRASTIDDMAARLAAQGMTFAVQGDTLDPAAFFQWCRRDAWRVLARGGRATIKPARAGRPLQAWTLEVSRGQVSGRTTITAGSASVWEPSEFSISVYPDRAPLVTMAGSNDVWIAAALLILDSSDIKFERRRGRISGNPSQASLALLRGWFAR